MAPSVDSISPSNRVDFGDTVVFTGTELGDILSLVFQDIEHGGQQSWEFTVDSDEQITAVATSAFLHETVSGPVTFTFPDDVQAFYDPVFVRKQQDVPGVSAADPDAYSQPYPFVWADVPTYDELLERMGGVAE